MFWSDGGENSRIERSDLMGGNRITIVQHLKGGALLDIDFKTNTLYWVDVQDLTLSSCSLDGTNNNKLISRDLSLNSVVGMTIYQVIITYLTFNPLNVCFFYKETADHKII